MTRWIPIAAEREKADPGVIAFAGYTVTKNESVGEAVYLAWRLDKQPATLLGRFDTASDAKYCCEKDFRGPDTP